MGLGRRLLVGTITTVSAAGIGTGVLAGTKTIDFDFKCYDAGSGISFSKELMDSYKIKELGIKIDGTTTYLDDYFYSENLGKKYTITIMDNIPVGNIYLAKKSEHYNPEVYTFDLADYTNKTLKITSDMNYVTLTQSKESVNAMIEIDTRTMPVDITLKDINLKSCEGLPVIMSKTVCAVNLKLEGHNNIATDDQPFTLEKFAKFINSNQKSQTMKTC